jgi:hypothetical protein
MSIVSSSPDPSFADLDIETLHNQLLEAAAPNDTAAQPAIGLRGGGFQYGSYIDARGFTSRTSVAEQAHPDRRMRLLAENSVSFDWPQLDHFAFRANASAAMRVVCPSSPLLGRVPPVHDADFAFVRPQAVEYRPAIPADYTTAIPSIFSHVDDEPIVTLQDGRSDAAVSRAAHGPPRSLSTRRVAPLSRHTTSLPSHPRTPLPRAVDRNASMHAPPKRKAQASHPRASEKTKVTPSTRASSARDVGEFVCPVHGCGKIYSRIGDLNRHLQSRAHQLPSFSCPSRCGK